MRYVAAYMLATLGGNKAPSEEDIKKIITAGGVGFEADKAKKVVSELSGKNLEELILKGSERLATIPSGGGGGAAPAASGAAAPAAEEKKEEKKEEEEEEDDDMGFSLFD